MSNYPDGMREADIPGWDDTESIEVCNSEEQVHVVPPSLFDSLQELFREASDIANAKVVCPTHGYCSCACHLPELVKVPEHLLDFMKRLRHVLSEITIAGETLQCSFDGDVIVDRNGWDCPVCETHYDHPEYEG